MAIAPDHRGPAWWYRFRGTGAAYLFVLPVFILFVIFQFGPALASLFISFTDYEVGVGAPFVGLDNYWRLAQDPVFWTSVRVTAVYTAIVLPLTTLTALALAMLVHRAFRGVGIFRAIFFLPYVTSVVMAAIIWLWIYRPSENGLLNSILNSVGVEPFAWLLNRDTVLPALAVMSTWKGFGYSMLIFVAGLQAIPDVYLEAAQVDGASSWQGFRQITLPLLKPVLFFVVVIETIASFQVFDAVYVMTSGGPARASFSLVYMLYNQGFQYFDFGYASAIGFFLFVVVFLLAMLQRRLFGSDAT